MKFVLVILLISLKWQSVFAQDSLPLRNFDVLPIITYSAETELNLGFIGFRYFNLGSGNEDIPVSIVNTSTIYTTRNQLFLESGFQFFLSNKDRLHGRLYYINAPDRNYGLGNDPDLIIIEENNQEILNYLNVDVTRIGFTGTYQKVINEKYVLRTCVSI